MPACWSYQRTSTAKQAAADRSGMDRQEAALRQWLADHPDYQLADALIDAGVSAGKGRNRTKGALSTFIQGGRDGTIPPGSCLVVESWSRFSREVATASLKTLLNDVWGQGLAISFCTDGVVLTSELIDREDHRLHALLGAMGQARREWEERSRRSKGAISKRNQQQDSGMVTPGRIPWWLMRQPDGSIALDPVGAATVRRLVELATDGIGQHLLARQMQEERRPTPRGGVLWTGRMVRHCLQHASLSGALQRRDRVIHGYYPPVITPAQHEALRRVQAAMSATHGGSGTKVYGRNLFQGVAVCSECGGGLMWTRPNPRSRAGHPGFIRCKNASYAKKDERRELICASKRSIDPTVWEAHALTRLQRAVWEELLRNPADDERLAGLRQRQAELQTAVAQAEDRLQTLEERAESLWADGGDAELVNTATRAVSKARERAAALQGELGEASRELAVLAALPRAADAAAELTAEIAAFMRGVADGSADRVKFNRWLCSRRPAIRFELDIAGRRAGLRVGDGDVDWQPVLAELDLAALRRGMTESTNITFDADQETLEMLNRLPRTEEGLADLGVALRDALGSDGEALAQG